MSVSIVSIGAISTTVIFRNHVESQSAPGALSSCVWVWYVQLIELLDFRYSTVPKACCVIRISEIFLSSLTTVRSMQCSHDLFELLLIFWFNCRVAVFLRKIVYKIPENIVAKFFYLNFRQRCFRKRKQEIMKSDYIYRKA